MLWYTEVHPGWVLNLRKGKLAAHRSLMKMGVFAMGVCEPRGAILHTITFIRWAAGFKKGNYRYLGHGMDLQAYTRAV